MIAQMMLGRPLNGPSSLAWVEQSLAPTLSPSKIVVMNNRPANKSGAVCDVPGAQWHQAQYLPHVCAVAPLPKFVTGVQVRVSLMRMPVLCRMRVDGHAADGIFAAGS